MYPQPLCHLISGTREVREALFMPCCWYDDFLLRSASVCLAPVIVAFEVNIYQHVTSPIFGNRCHVMFGNKLLHDLNANALSIQIRLITPTSAAKVR
jgi:hypothetical protein